MFIPGTDGSCALKLSALKAAAAAHERIVAEHKLASTSSMSPEDLAEILDKLQQEVLEQQVKARQRLHGAATARRGGGGAEASSGGSAGPAAGQMTDDEIIRTDPDPTRNIRHLPNEVWPLYKWCQSHWRRLTFPKFESTLVLVTSKDVKVSDYLDFERDLPVSAPPHCDASLLSNNLAVDHIKELLQPTTLNYKPEAVLKEAYRNLNTKKVESVQQIGSRVAYALQTNPKSWVLNSLATLHWRIRGNAAEAITCAKLSYQYAPNHAKDIPLLSLANILHSTEHIKQALKLTNAALEHSPEVVALHFSIANMYAALNDSVKATQFYQATLALQSSFLPARERLLMMQCGKMLHNPHLFQDNPAITTYDPTPILANLRKVHQQRAQKKKKTA